MRPIVIVSPAGGEPGVDRPCVQDDRETLRLNNRQRAQEQAGGPGVKRTGGCRAGSAFAIRSLRATPIVTAVATVSLALGIRANTAIFSRQPRWDPLLDRTLRLTDASARTKNGSSCCMSGMYIVGCGDSRKLTETASATTPTMRSGTLRPGHHRRQGDRLLEGACAAQKFPRERLVDDWSRLFTREKIAVLAPMPSASERIATAVTIGVARSARTARRRSCTARL
jgi:hypothetical protein